MQPEETNEQHQEHADRVEFDILMESIQRGDASPEEKDSLRKLLVAGYRNLNGDPLEKKVKLLARVDWEQIKRSLADSKKLSRILAAVEEIKAKTEEKKCGRNVYDLIADAKKDIRYVAIAALVFPGGAALISALEKIFSHPVAQ